jgi:Undecaprenyl-phosphate glucose phosphotransferase
MLNLSHNFTNRAAVRSRSGRLGISLANIEPLLASSDAVLVLFSSIVGGAGYQLFLLQVYGDVGIYIGIGMVAGLIYVFAARRLGLYELHVLLGAKREIWQVVICWLFAVMLLTLLLFLLKLGSHFSRGSYVFFVVLGLSLLVAWRDIAKRWIQLALSNGAIHGRQAIIIGSEQELASLGRATLLRDYGTTELDRFTLLPYNANDSNLSFDCSGLDAAVERARETSAEEIVLALPWHDRTQLDLVRDRLRMSPLPVWLLPDQSVRSILSQPITSQEAVPAIALQRGPLTGSEQFFKRTFDIVVAGFVLLIMLPVILAAAAAIKLTSSGPIVFRQRRNGFNGQEFIIYKFKTMSVFEDGHVIPQATAADRRVTTLGRLLRRTSIDELPQLVNVLRGDMSLVGPRPHALAHNDQYGRLIADYAFRNHVRPGITGWAQINGLRGGTSRLEHMARRIEHDLWYINNWNPWLDVKILARTCIEVLRGRGAH